MAPPALPVTVHPYRSPATDPHEARPEAGETSLRLALGVLVAVSLIQLVTAYHEAGLRSVQTIVGGGFLAAGLWGLARRRRS
jgi:hypothetical protein